MISGARRPTGRTLVGALVGAVVVVGVAALGGQSLVASQGATASSPVVALDAAEVAPAERSGSDRGPVAADAAADEAEPLQAPLLDLVTPPPPPPAPDRTQDRASRDGARSGSGSGSSGSGSSGSGSSGSGSSGSGSSGSGSSGSARPPASGGGGSTASQVISLVNAARADAGCGPVSADGALTAAAQAHSADMAAGDYFSHTSKDGRTFADRIRAAGYTGGAMAENIAAGQSSAAAVMAGWMDSPGHRATILTCSYRHIGVGVARGGSYGTYWTQDFGG